ncbi:MAG: DUF4123 domain-containing protein [Gammaproteobacteria bacterium]|nr:DUF4123 domain-containing protein [Gammaproteobacteria bacterium]
MSESVWLTYADVQQLNHSQRSAVVMLYANSRDDFQGKLLAFSERESIRFSYQLAPLEASTFFSRHGEIWLFNDVQSLGAKEVRIIYLDDELTTTQSKESRDYLLRHTITDIDLLDEQFGRSPKLFAPNEIFKLLWPYLDIPANMFEAGWQDLPQPVFEAPITDEAVEDLDKEIFGEPLPPLRCYMLIDASQHELFPPHYPDYRIECLYQGELAEKSQDIAPYLIEIIPDEFSGLQSLFSKKTELNEYNWEDNMGIFIHSRHDFDTVLHHLRRFVVLRDESDKWYFFRFYDPIVLRQYMEVIATHPDKLAKFFGYEKRIIHAFASGVDDTFNYYMLKFLPPVEPIPIVMTDWEIEGLGRQRWNSARENIANYIIQTYSHIISSQQRKELLEDLDEAMRKGYDSEITTMRYALCKANAAKNQLDFVSVEAKIRDLNSVSANERADLLWAKFMQGEE